ncbi:MAG: cytochrome P450 [Steroidobacteraceae bacterium]
MSEFDITDPAVAKCPFDYYAAMRRESPVHRDPGTGCWWVALRETIAKASFDPQTFSSKSELVLRLRYRPRAQALWEAAGMRALQTLVTGDSPEHDDYRALGMGLFTPAKVEQLTPHIEARVHELIDEFASRGNVEFVNEFAARLPGSIVCDEFGLPQEDQPRFKEWTDAAIGLISPDITEDREVELVQKLIELFKYLEVHLKRNTQESTGRIINTLATMNKRDGTPFTFLERAWMTVNVFVGGNETTMNMLSAGLRKLATEPDLQNELRAAPDKIPQFTEEMLRLEGSVQALLRVATRDVEIDGATIPKGANVVLCTGSGNRDETFWEHADEFRLDRANGRRHMTFGQGRHVCIGMHLARRELNTAYRILLERLNNIRLAVPPGEIEQVPLPFHRSIVRLPLQFDSTMR